jgi:hypothetical protein
MASQEWKAEDRSCTLTIGCRKAGQGCHQNQHEDSQLPHLDLDSAPDGSPLSGSPEQ